jgi:hypothetical protein
MRSPSSLYIWVSVCVPLQSRIVGLQREAVARQRLGNHFPAATNRHATIEELLEAVFSMRSASYQIICSERNMGD